MTVEPSAAQSCAMQTAILHDAPALFTYRLKFPRAGTRGARDLEFEAPDAWQALMIARQEARHDPVELWRDGRMLCTIRRADSDYWEINALDQAFTGR